MIDKFAIKTLQTIMLVALLFFAFSNPKAVQAKYYSDTVIPATYVNIGTPRDMISLPNGNIWYVDSQNSRVVKINASGEVLRVFGGAGNQEGEFVSTLTSITTDSDGYLYVSDFKKIYKFDFNGGFIKSWGTFGPGPGEISEPQGIRYNSYTNEIIVSNTANNNILRFDTDGNFISEFGSAGTGNGEFQSPQGLTTDGDGNIFVVDGANHRVQKFSSNGTFIRTYGSADPGIDQLIYPQDVEILSNGDIAVTSQNTPSVKIFELDGNISEWGQDGTQEDQFKRPEYLSVATDNSIWVSDWDQRRLQHFTSAGVFIGKIGNSGTTDGLFTNPYSMDFDELGNIYVLDATGRVQRFDADGTNPVTIIPAGVVGSASYRILVHPVTQYIFISSETTVSVFNAEGTLISHLGTQGLNGPASGNGDFNHARGMAFDGIERLYVADFYNARVQKFDLSHLEDPDFATTYQGGYVSQWSVTNFVDNIFIDSNDNVYVSPLESVAENEFELSVQKYDTDGTPIMTVMNEFGTQPTNYYTISGIYVDSVGRIYISDGYFNLIQIYNSDGTYYETLGERGSGINQFDGVASAKINPYTNDLVAVDSNNHRLQILSTGVKINNLISSADVINIDSSLSLVKRTVDPNLPEIADIQAELYLGDYIVSDFQVNLSQDRDWNSVNAIVLPNESKSLVVNLNPDDAPGISSTHSIYVVKQPGQDQVRVCTTAQLINDVALGCEGYTLSEGDTELSTVLIGGIEYWKVTGLTGTGAMGDTSPEPSPTPTPTPELISSNQSNSNSSNTSSGNTTPSCSSPAPAGSPDLFQINVSSNDAKLFFTPISNANAYYFSFSKNPNAEEHGTKVSLAREGVQNFTINLLNPGETYYFKVRGQNDCMPGQWSNIMKIRTGEKNKATTTFFYKNTRVVTKIAQKIKAIFSQITVPKTEKTIEPEVIKEEKPVVIIPEKEKQPAKAKTCFLWFCW